MKIEYTFLILLKASLSFQTPMTSKDDFFFFNHFIHSISFAFYFSYSYSTMESVTAKSPPTSASSMSMSDVDMSENSLSSNYEPPAGLSGPSAILHEILQTYDHRVRPNFGGKC